MKKQDLLFFWLNWLAADTSALVHLLTALVPLMALGVAAYALYVVSKKKVKKPSHWRRVPSAPVLAAMPSMSWSSARGVKPALETAALSFSWRSTS